MSQQPTQHTSWQKRVITILTIFLIITTLLTAHHLPVMQASFIIYVASLITITLITVYLRVIKNAISYARVVLWSILFTFIGVCMLYAVVQILSTS